MRIDILSDNPISSNMQAGDTGIACAFPLCALLGDGSVCCVYRQGTEKYSTDGVLVAQSSQDMGNTWSPAVPVFDGRQSDKALTVVSAAPCVSREGTLLVVFNAVEGLPADVYMFSVEGKPFPRRLCSSRSTDRGQTWQPPDLIDLPEFYWPAITSKPVTLPDGEICMPVEYKLPSGVIGTGMAFSSDDGKTFASPVTVAADSSARLNLCDARFDCLPDGRLLCHLWTFLQENEQTIEVHQSYSSDKGRTWTKPKSIGFVGQITAPLSLPGGQLIAASNYRHPPDGIRLWVSLDQGEHWNLDEPIQMWDLAAGRMVGKVIDPGQTLTGKDGIWDTLPSFTFGTPDLLALPDGSLLLTYYATLNEIIHVRACRFQIHGG